MDDADDDDNVAAAPGVAAGMDTNFDCDNTTTAAGTDDTIASRVRRHGAPRPVLPGTTFAFNPPRGGPVGVILLWLVLSAKREHRLAEDHLRGTEVDALVCAWLQLASLQCIRAPRIRQAQAEHRAGVAHRWWLTCFALVRGHVVISSPPVVVCHVEDQAGLRHGVLPVLLAGTAKLVHHAHGLLQHAQVALGRVLPRLVLATVGVVHVE
eukprot:582939-Pleurochrysis_carterae.AAC.1